MPRSHQEHNAAAVAAAGAGVVLDEPTCTPQRLAATVSDLLRHPDHRQALGEALHRLIPDGTVEFTRRLAAWLPPT
jgi:UDP-N-acetylglucosamine:LPS N-acetylglucosamine transferase